MKPKLNYSNTPTKHQHESHMSQQMARAVRPQLPREGTADGRPTHRPGELPKGGYQSVWSFNGTADTKNSPTQVREKKVY